MAAKIKLDSAGMAAMLKSSGVRSAVHQAAEEIAERVKHDPAIVRHGIAESVDVLDITTDRAAAIVAIAHAAGRGIEAKHASLTKAVTG